MQVTEFFFPMQYRMTVKFLKFDNFSPEIKLGRVLMPGSPTTLVPQTATVASKIVPGFRSPPGESLQARPVANYIQQFYDHRQNCSTESCNI